MSNIKMKNRNKDPMPVVISNWRDGLKLIKKNPTEVGYYIETAEFLEKYPDYKSAAILLELGIDLDFIKNDDVPIMVCKKLQYYYKHLPNKPKYNKNYHPIYDVR